MIGVTGHRFLAEYGLVRAGVDAALAHIEHRIRGGQFALLSSLAEGADRLVAEEVLARPGAVLIVPLPLPLSEYVNDFLTRESRRQFAVLLKRATQVMTAPRNSHERSRTRRLGNLFWSTARSW